MVSIVDKGAPSRTVSRIDVTLTVANVGAGLMVGEIGVPVGAMVGVPVGGGKQF